MALQNTYPKADQVGFKQGEDIKSMFFRELGYLTENLTWMKQKNRIQLGELDRVILTY